jgi:primosomal protein N' (replication factor Y)
VITGKYALATLTTRYKDIAMPEIRIVDTKEMQRRKMMTGPFSPQLLAAMRAALDNGEQVILFQNRRGFAPMVECKQCGWVPHCQNCDVSLTLHKNTSQLTCHYCGFTYRVPEQCPNCESRELVSRGFGTEKVEDQILELFPDARVARMDLDTTRTRSAYERIIGDFSAGRTNILIGTQMVTKGLDFDRVSVVGILNADSMLNYPDFRAYEHAFTMMSQVSGRAGRKGKQGLVLLQTKNKDLAVVRQVVTNDFQSFFRDLEEERRDFRYPPFSHLIYIYMRNKDNRVLDSAAMEMGSRLRQWFGNRVLGPDKHAVAKVKAMNIRKIVLKLELGIDLTRVRKYLRDAERQMMDNKQYASLQIHFDVDPL